MKRFLSILCLLFALSASASDRVTITITVTNIPAAANTLTVNAAVRTWRASPTVPATEIAIGASIGASATNLFRQIVGYPYSGPTTVGFSSTNIVTIQGAVAQAMVASSSGTWATITYTTNTVALMNMVRTEGDQTINGQKKFSNLVTTGTMSVTGNIEVTNASPDIRFYDTGGGVDEKRTRVTADADGFAVTFWKDDLSAAYEVFILGRGASYNDPEGATFFTPVKTPYLYDSGLTNVIGTNIVFKGTNYSQGIWGHTRANNTSLANGNNATVDFGTKVFVKIKSGGPTADFAICGIAGGADGREIELYNATGQNMTISNDSGVEPTAANRIYTQTGGDRATTGNGYVTLRYDTEDSRWVIKSFEP